MCCFILLLLFLPFFQSLHTVTSREQYNARISSNPDYYLTYGVALTTIPPRYNALSHVMKSWLQQVYQPQRVCLFIPEKYRRFKRKNPVSAPVPSSYRTNVRLIHTNFQKDFLLQSSLKTKKLKIVTLPEDYGPISKFLGVILDQRTLHEDETALSSDQYCFHYKSEDVPDFWIFSDDDVFYSQYTILKYNYYLTHLHGVSPLSVQSLDFGHLVLTQFVEDYRIFYYLNPKEADNNTEPVIPRHIQGVDTFLTSSNLFLSHYFLQSVFNYRSLISVVKEFHNDLCPESFYQDDYLISFFFSLGKVPVYSIWNNDKLVFHVDNVSVNNFQMHKDPLVFDREEQTKSCIYTYAGNVSSALWR
jgi:hypothetical protein